MDSIDAMESEILELVRGADWGAAPDPAQARRVEELMLRSFRAQAAAIAPYGAYVRHLGVDPERTTRWEEIPPVPASAFKSHDLSSAPASSPPDEPMPAEAMNGPAFTVFETSGTTISQPGRVRLSSTELYEASLLGNFRRHLLPDGVRLRALVLGPSASEEPQSSLWFMVDRAVRELCADAFYFVHHGEPRWKALDDAFKDASSSREPLLLLGTSLLFMAYFQRLRIRNRSFPMPAGSRAMDTGGAKGQISEFMREEVEAAFQRHLGIPRTHLVNEYGMAEMASQFYDDTLLAQHEHRAARPGKRIPPWVRTRVLDPETLEEKRDGGTGLLVHYDLANVEIPLAIQTEDIGRREGDRLILEGRLLGAEARGCSLAFERFLEGDPT